MAVFSVPIFAASSLPRLPETTILESYLQETLGDLVEPQGREAVDEEERDPHQHQPRVVQGGVLRVVREGVRGGGSSVGLGWMKRFRWMKGFRCGIRVDEGVRVWG